MGCIKCLTLAFLCGLVFGNDIENRGAPFEHCDRLIPLGADKSIHINSPNYPNHYMPMSSCRYIITAPLDYEINVQCNLHFYKGPENCTTELFYISATGDRNLDQGQYYCGKGYIQQKSSFRTVVIAYTSASTYNSGYFSCFVETQPQECECGWTNSNSRKIDYDGERVKVNEYPFLVGFINIVSGRLFCAGTIISHRFVISAASCFNEDMTVNDIQIQLGSNNLKKGNEDPASETYPISRIIHHPMYNSKSRINDIALVMTSQNIDWSFEVGPICLPYFYSLIPFSDEKADMVGWGTAKFMGPPMDVLRKVSVNITTNNYCKSILPDLEAYQLCTISPPKEACLYDAGGPLVWNGNRLYAIAITGMTSSCGLFLPTVHTRITAYLEWISSTVGQDICLK